MVTKHLKHLIHCGSGTEHDIGLIHIWSLPTLLHWNVARTQLDVHILYWNKVLMVELVVEIFLVFWKSNINKSSQHDSNDHSPLHFFFRHRQYTNRALNPTRGSSASLYHDHDYCDHKGLDMMAVRSEEQFLAYSCCPVDVHVLSSQTGLGWQLEQDQDGNWTGLPVSDIQISVIS